MLSLPTAPLCEQYVASYVRAWAARREIAVHSDAFGNLQLTLRRGQAQPSPIVFAAHMDHPGFEAETMPPQGFLQARWRGGVQPEYFVGARVRFFHDDRWTRGTVHSVLVIDDRGRQRVETARIDVPRPVPEGAIGTWDLPRPTIRGQRVYARGCDDIAGVAAILAAFDQLRRGTEDIDIIALFTRAEEVGFAGAIGACQSGLLPRRARVIAVETSSEIPGVKMGDGPVLRVGDRSAVFSPGLTGRLGDIGENLARCDRRFRFQRKLMDGGTCESAVYCAYGYDTSGLCVALGNYHNMNRRRHRIAAEYIDLDDYGNLIKWFVAIARDAQVEKAQPSTFSLALRDLEKKWLGQLVSTADRTSAHLNA